MKSLLIFSFLLVSLRADLVVDLDQFGKELGGWDGKKKKFAEYEMSDSDYRTFRPIVTETPDGGRYISVRIDNRRGLFSSDDHALLQVTVDAEGKLVSLSSSIHAQGKSIKSDVILTTGNQAASMLGGDVVLKAGIKLVKDLSAKIAGEKKVEAGRVVYPAVIVHNYNKLMKCISNEIPNDKVTVEPADFPELESVSDRQ